jgi:hypothetical protein
MLILTVEMVDAMLSATFSTNSISNFSKVLKEAISSIPCICSLIISGTIKRLLGLAFPNPEVIFT